MRSITDALAGIIPGGVSVTDFAVAVKTDAVAARQLLDMLVGNGIGKRDGEVFEFADTDRLRAAILAIESGEPVDGAAEEIGWRDFEGLAAEILNEKGFATIRNLILTKPRMEIDVVGINLGVAMLVDCKHWRRYSNSALREAVRKQVRRTKHYVASTRGAVAVPAIVTLYQNELSLIDRVPVVPISQFASFVDEFYGNIEDMTTIR